MARRNAEAELAQVETLIRDLRTGVVADTRAHFAAGRHAEAASLLAEIERGVGSLEGRIQSFRRPPLHG